MGLWNSIIEAVADRVSAQIQGGTVSQRHRDHTLKGESYSVESEISEALADLMLMYSAMPIEGDSERARWLDALSSDFLNLHAKSAISTSFLTGDCIVVPSWNGRTIQNVVVGADDFEIFERFGDTVTACAYVIDRKERKGETWRLMQAVELVPYEGAGGVTYANRYRVFAARNGSVQANGLSQFPDWERRYQDGEWYVPNVDRLLIGRFRSHAVNPADLNAAKGAPICYGAGQPIAEIRYLLQQMHDEFSLSEKAIMADKRMFQREWRNGELVTTLPRGRERLFVDVMGQTSDMPIHDWSPDIRYQAYLDAIDKQEQLVERAVGVSPGIISRSNDMNYQNVDNVRKGQQKTVAFIETARRTATHAMQDLAYAWDALANYYGITPMGAWELKPDWSTEYVESFADQQNAILAGASIGATDAIDYRRFVMDETEEQARARVDEIRAAQGSQASVLMPL